MCLYVDAKFGLRITCIFVHRDMSIKEFFRLAIKLLLHGGSGDDKNPKYLLSSRFMSQTV